MRELKFRAFDEAAGYMVAPASIEYLVAQNMATFPEDYYHDNYVFMQYTGLKDKHGVEIYEGDIVDDQFNCGQLHVIFWNEKTGGFSTRSVKYDAMSESYFESSLSISTETTTKGEVIGNIHANPELMEDK